ncbi:NADPH-dependent ferric siderophore reductase [Chimaeribacter californicus]|uniref:NADPH-dependent ferric siderophore reductase n=1 Tax=Chimaeribacter californicus TaxID=2060067 RepID=A0A2N5E4J1_9GAMM|nr:siderophore-interacting protein [Chimaeribacter californicus]PLR35910.1 NADPH-dependent ferric siderophore reductase [Chimaeribacter californicus]
MQHSTSPDITPLPTRVRNALVFRQITVKQADTVAGCFRRIVFHGEQLNGFSSAGFDDHIKIFFPDRETGELHLPQVTPEGIVWGDKRPAARDYTPLHFDAAANELTVDFFIHAQGLASDWAVGAKPGDALAMGGPRGSLVVPETYAHQIYLCDESGLPALRRRLLALAPHQHIQVTAIVSVHRPEVKAYLADLGHVQCEWLPADAAQLSARMAALPLPPEDSFMWITGEGSLVKTISDQLLERGADADRLRAVAYWHQK